MVRVSFHLYSGRVSILIRTNSPAVSTTNVYITQENSTSRSNSSFLKPVSNFKMPESTSLTFSLLPDAIRQSSAIGAEVQLPPGMSKLDLDRLTENDKETLRKALFENQVIVIRGQKGIDPTVLPQFAKVFDPSASDVHSAGEKAVSDPKNILSAYKAGRIPKAPQVGIIGSGNFHDYEGLKELEIIHLVCLHIYF